MTYFRQIKQTILLIILILLAGCAPIRQSESTLEDDSKNKEPKVTVLLERILQGGQTAIWSVAFSPDGKLLAGGAGLDKTITIWEVDSSKILRRLKEPLSFFAFNLTFSPDGKTLACSYPDELIFKIWDVESGQVLRTLKAISNPAYSTTSEVAFSPDGKQVIGVIGSDINIWNFSSGKELKKLTGHTEWVRSIAFSPDGKLLASGGDDNAIIIWDFASDRELRRFRGYSKKVNQVAFTPDGGSLAYSGEYQSSGVGTQIRLIDVTTGIDIHNFKGPGDCVHSFAISPNGKWIAGSFDIGLGIDDSIIKIWDIKTGQELQTLKGHTQWVLQDITFSPDSKRLVGGNCAGAITVWRLEENSK